jgi:uncharacterized membrane protein YedE/YeeE
MWDLIRQPWPWYVSGALIALVMALMLYFGKSFGVSANFRTVCSALGAGKNVSFFRFDWKSQIWNLVFLVGAALGGALVYYFLSDNSAPAISPSTVQDLTALGIAPPTSPQPAELFGPESLSSLKGFLLLFGGGILVGFGARWAGGCTSGHAISGISALQVPSIVAVVGFFIGGLLMTHILLPIIL